MPTYRHKYKKRGTRRHKKRTLKTKKSMTTRRRRRVMIRGGKNDLGEIFLKMVKNEKIIDEESSRDGAQSEEYQDAMINQEELTKELVKRVGEERAIKIRNLLSDYVFTKSMAESEMRSNNEYYKLGNGGQGEYEYQNNHYEVANQLRDELGVDLDEDEEEEKEPARKKGRF